MYNKLLEKIEIYKLFYKNKNVNLKGLFKNCEKIIFLFNEFINNNKFEHLTKIFAEYGFIPNKCLLKLEEINSSYKNEYESLLLMKELKEIYKWNE